MNLRCPNCQGTLAVPEIYVGQTMKCPLCSRTFVVPAAPEAVAAPPPPAPRRLQPLQMAPVVQAAAEPAFSLGAPPAPAPLRSPDAGLRPLGSGAAMAKAMAIGYQEGKKQEEIERKAMAADALQQAKDERALDAEIAAFIQAAKKAAALEEKQSLQDASQLRRELAAAIKERARQEAAEMKQEVAVEKREDAEKKAEAAKAARAHKEYAAAKEKEDRASAAATLSTHAKYEAETKRLHKVYAGDVRSYSAAFEADMAADPTERGRRAPGRTLGAAAMNIGRALPGGNLLGAVGNVASAATGEGAAGIAGALGGLGAMAGPIGAIAAAAPAAIGALGQVRDTIVSLAGKANPGVLMLYQRALDDIQGVIGQRLVPVLELFADGARLVGDVLQTILPSQVEFREAIAPLRSALQEMRPAIADLVMPFKEMGRQNLQQIALGLKMFADQLSKYAWVAQLGMSVSGFGVLGGGALQSGVGAAYRPSQINSLESYTRSVYTATAGMGGAIGPQEKNTVAIESLTKALEDLAKKMADRGLNVSDDLLGSARGMIDSVAGAVKRGLRGW